MKKLWMLGILACTCLSLPALAEDQKKGEGMHPPRGGIKMFEKMDANADGLISKDEFLKPHEEHFAKMDTNADGKVSKDEAKAMGEKMRAKMEEMRKEMKEYSDSEEKE